MTAATSTAGASDRPRLIALIVSGASFMAQLDSTVVVTALPRMARSFSVPTVDLSIGVTVYLLVQAAVLPASSWAADRFGARRVFVAAMLIFSAASLLCGLCHNLNQFVAARMLQATGAALMTSVGRVVMLRSVSKADLISTMTIATVPMLIAPTLGPPLGGFITTYMDWPWVFLLNLPLGVATIALVLRYIPASQPGEPRAFDSLGFLLTGGGLALALFGLDRLGAAADWRAPVGLMLVGGALCALAVRHARRKPFPLIPLGPLRHANFRMNILGGGALARLPVRAAPFVLPLMFQAGMGMSPFRSGLLLMFLSAGDLALKAAIRRTLRRFGFRRVLWVSSLLMALGIAACAGFGLGTPLLVIVVVLTACGMFRSLLFTGLSSLTYADIPPDEMGPATVMWNMTQQVTNAVAVSLAALAMHASAAARGGGGLTLADCRWGLLLNAVLGLGATVSLFKLPHDAGSEVSGHAAKSRTATSRRP